MDFLTQITCPQVMFALRQVRKSLDHIHTEWSRRQLRHHEHFFDLKVTCARQLMCFSSHFYSKHHFSSSFFTFPFKGYCHFYENAICLHQFQPTLQLKAWRPYMEVANLSLDLTRDVLFWTGASTNPNQK